MHQIEIGGFLVHLRARLRVERLGRPLAVDRAVERRRAVLGGERRIGAPPEQILREIELAVDRRDEQRARAIARAHLVDVGAGVEQRAHRFEMSLARGEEQRRDAALRGHELVELIVAVDAGNLPAAAAASGRSVAAALRLLPGRRRIALRELAERRRIAAQRHEIGDLRRRLEIGAVVRQHLEHRGAIGRRGKHHRRQAAQRFRRVHVGAAGDERRDGSRVAGRGGEHQRRRTVRRRSVDVGAGLEQRLEHLRAAVPRREQQRRVCADARRRLDVRAGVEQRLHEVGVVLHGGPVERRHAVALRRVDVGRLLQQRLDAVAVALHRRVGDGRARRRVQQRRERQRAERGESKPSHDHLTLHL